MLCLSRAAFGFTMKISSSMGKSECWGQLQEANDTWWLVFPLGSWNLDFYQNTYVYGTFFFVPAAFKYTYSCASFFYWHSCSTVVIAAISSWLSSSPCSPVYSVYCEGNDICCLEIFWWIHFSPFLHIIIWRLSCSPVYHLLGRVLEGNRMLWGLAQKIRDRNPET